MRVVDKPAAHGPVLVAVDQPNTIGALPAAVARVAGHQPAYLTGLAMCRIADLYLALAKTDVRDAFIAATSRTLHQVDVSDNTLAELHVLIRFDGDLTAEFTRLSNRVRDLFTGISPTLARAIGPHIAHPAVL